MSSAADCTFCNDRRAASSVAYKCGTRIEKYFPQNRESNTEAGWYPGTIIGHFYDEDCQQNGTTVLTLLNFIDYDDGDQEAMVDVELRDKDCVKIIGTLANNSNKKARRVVVVAEAAPVVKGEDLTGVVSDTPSSRSNNGSIKQEPSDSASIKIEESSSAASGNDDNNNEVVPDGPVSSTSEVTRAGASATVNEDAAKVKSEGSAEGLSPEERRRREPSDSAMIQIDDNYRTAAASRYDSNHEVVVPDGPVLSTSETIRAQVLSTVNEDAQVKSEGSARGLSPEERQRRKECFERWKRMNTDPKTKLGRYVFRRACHKQCITTILGGSGMMPWPTVKNPPMLYDTKTATNRQTQIENPFIRPGEFYVAGNEAWNSFGPRFPGDSGFVHVNALSGDGKQKEFHMFVECANKPEKRHWHGKDAMFGRMYVGVYRRVAEEDAIISTVRFAHDLNSDNQKSIAQDYVRYYYKAYGEGNLGPGVEERHIEYARDTLFEGGEEKWDLLSQRSRDVWTMIAYLIKTDYTEEIVPIEFARFDEDLYQCLVSYDCAVSRGPVRGRVLLDADALHQYY